MDRVVQAVVAAVRPVSLQVMQAWTAIATDAVQGVVVRVRKLALPVLLRMPVSMRMTTDVDLGAVALLVAIPIAAAVVLKPARAAAELTVSQ